MPLLSLAAFAATHGTSKQAAGKWKTKGFLTIRDGKVDAEASDAVLQGLRPGRFRDDRQHGGRREKGTRYGVPVDVNRLPPVDADNLVDAGQLDPSWLTGNQHLRSGNPLSLGRQLAAIAERVGDPDVAEDVADLADVLAFAEMEDDREDIGWWCWPAQIAETLAAELGIADRTHAVREALQEHMRARLLALGREEQAFTCNDLAPL